MEMWIKVYTLDNKENIYIQFIYPVNKVRLFYESLIYNLNYIITYEYLIIVTSTSLNSLASLRKSFLPTSITLPFSNLLFCCLPGT